MRALISQVNAGFTSYVMENHMLVLAVATIIYIMLKDKKKSKSVLLFLGASSAMAFLVWFPLTGAVLMKYQTSLQHYESLWNLVPVPALISFGAICLIQNEFAGENKKRSQISTILGVGITFILIAMLGNMGAIRTISQDQANSMRERKQVVNLLRGEGLIVEGDELGKVWAPTEILEVARQEDASITLLYGRDLWDGKIAAYGYDQYNHNILKLYDFMDSIAQEGLSFGSDDEELREKNFRSRAMDDCEFLRLALENGSAIWIFPESCGERMQYATDMLWEQYGYKVDVVAMINGYIVYAVEH